MDGWLQQPNGAMSFRFHRDLPARTRLRGFIDRGEPIPGQPALLKREERLSEVGGRAVQNY